MSALPMSVNVRFKATAFALDPIPVDHGSSSPLSPVVPFQFSLCTCL